MCIRFINKGGKAPKLQEKSVTITNNGTTNVTPDTGYDGLNNVAITTNVDTSGYNAKMKTSGLNANSSLFLYITEIPLIDTSNYTNMKQFFNNYQGLIQIPQLNTSNVTNMQQMFNNCRSLTAIPLLNTSSVTNMSSMFRDCRGLTTIPLLNTDSVIDMWYMFNGCNSLSNESLNNILAMCTGATSYSGTKTLRYIGITSAQATTCQSLSNYQAFLDAGWTTGY